MMRLRAYLHILRCNWLTKVLLVTIVFLVLFALPKWALADDPFVNQEIHYTAANAGELFLVWGVNGWNTVPEAMRPAGTVVKENVMNTPMHKQGDDFVVSIQVPPHSTVDYGFLQQKM